MKKAGITQIARIAALAVCCVLALCLLACFALGLGMAIGGSMEMVPAAEQTEKAVLGGTAMAVFAGLCLIPCIALSVVFGRKVSAAGKRMAQMKALSRETAAQSERTLS